MNKNEIRNSIMKKEPLNLLYRSFDETLNPEEQAQLSKALSESASLHAEKKRIQETRDIISGSAVESFQPFFAKRVMQRIHATAETRFNLINSFGDLLKIFRPVLLTASTTIIIIVAFSVWTSGSFSVESVLGIPGFTIDNITNSIK
jgi:hypothetical protein